MPASLPRLVVIITISFVVAAIILILGATTLTAAFDLIAVNAVDVFSSVIALSTTSQTSTLTISDFDTLEFHLIRDT